MSSNGVPELFGHVAIGCPLKVNAKQLQHSTVVLPAPACQEYKYCLRRYDGE